MRIFISYKRNSDPDEPLAMQLCAALKPVHDVFIDQESILVGQDWAKRIEAELGRVDFLVSLLSAESIQSEMVQAEIATAHRIAGERSGKPVILPVRLAHRDPFEYPLSAYLGPIQYAFWSGPADTSRLIEQLVRAIDGDVDDELFTASELDTRPVVVPGSVPRPTASAQPLETPEGTMDWQSHYYVERPSDGIALRAIQRPGATITIKGPRQMGKSSLLIRTRDAARELGKQVAFLDFQLFDRSALNDADAFFRQFCVWLTDELGLDDRVDDYWHPSLGNSLRCTRYVERYVLRALGGPLTLAMDEVESIFDTSFRSDFFGMLRSWHNRRQTGSVWKDLDLVLVTSTEPYQLIDNLNQSPFNVGEVIDLVDLTLEQVADLNERHGRPLMPEDERRLYELLSGHPYLVRRALYLVASGSTTAAELFAEATEDRGPFGDHLRHHLYRLRDRDDLIQGLAQVIRSGRCQDERVCWGLRGAGLVRQEGQTVAPRCRLYADYFRERIGG
jgi:hypothetical protein